VTFAQWVAYVWRLKLWGHCPNCNDDAPELDGCMVCCGRTHGVRDQFRDWAPTKQEKELMADRWEQWCAKGTIAPEWDYTLANGYPHPAEGKPKKFGEDPPPDDHPDRLMF